MPNQRPVTENAPQTRSIPIKHRHQQPEQIPNVIFIPLDHSSVSSSSSSSSLSAYVLSKWTIPPQGLPPPPMWLERSTLACRHQKQPQQVLDDIAAFLRPTIVECHYNHHNKIDCRLACSLQFVIYLWLDDDDDDDNNDDDANEGGTVLVELQRRQGCAIKFHHIKQQLFLALQQHATTNTSHDRSPLDLSRNRPPTCSWIQKETDGNNNGGDNDNDSLAECQRLLRDNPMTGMEQLLFLVVNHPKSAEQIMSGPCHEFFRQLMTESLQLISPTQNSHKYGMDHRRRLALHILVNVLAQLAKTLSKTSARRQQLSPSQEKSLIELHMDDLFWQRTVIYLRDCIRKADCHPQEAALAIQCLRHLYMLTSPPTDMNDHSFSLSLSSLDDLLLLDEGFLKDLQRAHVLGRIHHQPLATEACRLVEYYGETVM